MYVLLTQVPWKILASDLPHDEVIAKGYEYCSSLHVDVQVIAMI